MRKFSKILAAMLCAALASTCVVSAGAEDRQETKTVSLDVMLVVDDTYSMRRTDPNHIASLALEKFANAIPHEGSRVGMATYDDDILTSQPILPVYTRENKDALMEFARTGLTQDGRFTDLPNALHYAVEQLQSLPQIDSSPVIIAVSDGENDFLNAAAEARSNEKLEEVIKAGIPVYLIVINASNTSGVQEYMEMIAGQTNGAAFFVESGDEIDTLLDNLALTLYDYEDVPENRFIEYVGPSPMEWPFSLGEGIFEANLELSYTAGLDLELTGPDGSRIPMENSQRAVVSTLSDRDGFKTMVRLMEPDEGPYVMRLSSPDGAQLVFGRIILNNEIYVQVELSSASVQGGGALQVTAKLMRGKEQYTDLEFTSLEASASIDGGQPSAMTRDDGASAFQGELTAPSQPGGHQVVVTVQGQKSFLRSSDPADFEVLPGHDSAAPSPAAPSPAVPSADPPGPSVWPVVAAGALLLAVLLAVAVIVLRQRSGRAPSGQYTRLQGTLTVSYLDSMGQHIWQKHVQPGGYYSKSSPRVSLGRMLRDQGGYEDIPHYFDKIQIAGLRRANNRLYVEVTGSLASPPETGKINRLIEVPTGQATDEMDSYDSVPSAVITFPDGTQTELSFILV